MWVYRAQLVQHQSVLHHTAVFILRSLHACNCLNGSRHFMCTYSCKSRQTVAQAKDRLSLCELVEFYWKKYNKQAAVQDVTDESMERPRLSSISRHAGCKYNTRGVIHTE